MAGNLHITFIQSELHWEDIGANLAAFEERITRIEGETDVILLPEMFNTGFSMNAKKLAEPMNFTTMRWMKQMAAQRQAVVAGSYIVKENGRYFNRFFWVEPSGRYDFYDKRHLFRMGDEHLIYTPGQKTTVAEWKGWKIMPLICYDLRFPVWSRNTVDEKTGALKYDLLLYVANWPAPRTQVWDTLLKARALENQCFVIGVNRIGSDGMGIDYTGHSMVVDYKGQLMNELSGREQIVTAGLDLEALSAFREKFPAWRDADRFDILS